MLSAADVGTSVMPPHFDWLPGCLESADEADKSSDTFQAQSRQAAVIMIQVLGSNNLKYCKNIQKKSSVILSAADLL